MAKRRARKRRVNLGGEPKNHEVVGRERLSLAQSQLNRLSRSDLACPMRAARLLDAAKNVALADMELAWAELPVGHAERKKVHALETQLNETFARFQNDCVKG